MWSTISDAAPAAAEIESRAIVYTEKRQPCSAYSTTRRPFFGDTHVHTKYSLDASTQDTRTTPAQAYAFARGQRLGIQPWSADGKPLRSIQLRRPLDFAVVTDHAELFGEVNICNEASLQGYDSWACKLYRHWPRAAYFIFNYRAAMDKTHMGFCGSDGELCRHAGHGPWQLMQVAAENAYDRSAECEFTSFVGYEWTGVEGQAANMHRNVIFRNRIVPDLPISAIDAPQPLGLWRRLERDCRAGLEGCDVLVIPHNSNLSNGYMFPDFDPQRFSVEDAQRRRSMEVLVEIMQHKGSSECFYGAGWTEDELCDFERLPYSNFAGKNVSLLREAPTRRDGFLRSVMNEGLKAQQTRNVNPYKWGFIGSTDTHLGAPGAVQEKGFPGHGGAGKPARADGLQGLPDHLEFNPGGLAVLWAEENSRDALFAAMRRREAYGTSGPRMVLRFFGGWDYPESLCETSDFAAQGYAGGVPMGGDLPRPGKPGGAPRFAVSAMMDAGSDENPGTALQRIQIIKGWVDARGEAHQAVYEVAGNPDNKASVDLHSCKPQGQGYRQLCTVWQDPRFSEAEPAYYYARVLENPSCRWSQHWCAAQHVDCADPDSIKPGWEACCAASHQPVIQERAWASPIWYTPPSR